MGVLLGAVDQPRLPDGVGLVAVGDLEDPEEAAVLVHELDLVGDADALQLVGRHAERHGHGPGEAVSAAACPPTTAS